jgi:AmmeMemoRadiSam system protein A
MSEMLGSKEQHYLLQLARRSIRHGLETGRPAPIEENLPESLRENGAAFVTLHKHDQLRGCIGSLEAYRPLAEDVAAHAFDAAFRDPRFPPVSADEFEDLHIHIEVLNPAEPITFSSEANLLTQLRPGIDGLILSEGNRKGTFLPTVWESLTTAEEFLGQLKLKAGLPAGYWSDTLKVERYTTQGFSE